MRSSICEGAAARNGHCRCCLPTPGIPAGLCIFYWQDPGTLGFGVGGGRGGEKREAIFEAALSHTLPIMGHKVHSFMDGYILSFVLNIRI